MAGRHAWPARRGRCGAARRLWSLSTHRNEGAFGSDRHLRPSVCWSAPTGFAAASARGASRHRRAKRRALGGWSRP
ncbi:hypothetical protein ACFPRL_15370 [Pseudoclavibacter helvolus]